MFLRGARIAQWYRARLRAGWSEVRVPAGAGYFSLHHRVQTRSEAHPASYAMGIKCLFPGGKVAEAWSRPLTCIYCWGQECVELYFHFSNTPSWRGAQLKHRDFTFIFINTLLRGIQKWKSKSPWNWKTVSLVVKALRFWSSCTVYNCQPSVLGSKQS
jgi:hypothetical protein